MGCTGFSVLISKISGGASCGRDAAHLWNCRFLEHSSRRLLHGQGVPCSICYFLEMISGGSIHSPNVVRAGGATPISVCGSTTAGTFILGVLYMLSLSRKEYGPSPQPSCGNSSRFICFSLKLYICCCPVLEHVPITQLGLSSSLSLTSSVSSQ